MHASRGFALLLKKVVFFIIWKGSSALGTRIEIAQLYCFKAFFIHSYAREELSTTPFTFDVEARHKSHFSKYSKPRYTCFLVGQAIVSIYIV